MKLQQIFNKLKDISKTARGKNVLTFLVFLVISTLFWFLMALNDYVQRDYDVEVEITDIPEDVTLLTTPPASITVSVKDRGRSLIRYDWGSAPKLRLRYKDFTKVADDRILYSEQQLNNFIRDAFGTGAEVISSKPDSLSLRFTSRPGERLPLFVDIDAQAAPQFIIYDKPVIPVDSVTVFSAKGIPSSIISVSTERISLRNLTDSTTVELTVNAPAGMKVEPAKIAITIPVQPLIAKKRSLNISAKNVPHGCSLLTFPSSVEVSYLLPMSVYSTDDFLPVATVNYYQIDSRTSTVPVDISNIPDYYRSVTYSPEKVEYVVEQH